MAPKPVPEEEERCDCCSGECDCGDCEACSEEEVQVARDPIPGPAKGAAAKAPRRKAGR